MVIMSNEHDNDDNHDDDKTMYDKLHLTQERWK